MEVLLDSLSKNKDVVYYSLDHGYYLASGILLAISFCLVNRNLPLYLFDNINIWHSRFHLCQKRPVDSCANLSLGNLVIASRLAP
jgi:hypothetical protein